jgi:hypothetical protein
MDRLLAFFNNHPVLYAIVMVIGLISLFLVGSLPFAMPLFIVGFYSACAWVVCAVEIHSGNKINVRIAVAVVFVLSFITLAYMYYSK